MTLKLALESELSTYCKLESIPTPGVHVFQKSLVANPTAANPDLPVTEAMVHAVVKLPDGAELMHWLAQPENKPEAERLARMDPSAVFLEMGRLAGKHAAVKPATAQRRSENEPRQKAPQDMTVTEYAAYRAEKLRAERRPMFGGGR